jgi:molybdopterin-containing oxidoreductase family iron-sulfur binding subunit
MPRKDAAELQSLQARLAGATGKKYWRSLEELADADEFRRWLGREFPEQATVWTDQPSRRRFLKLMAASLALAGLQGCRSQPEEKIVPYVEMPEEVMPGISMLYASAMPVPGGAAGVLVESHTGRPTMLEGNPEHPAFRNVTAAGMYAQASLLTLYDPDRSQTVLREGAISTWDSFLANLRPRIEAARQNNGRGLRILTEEVNSPTLAGQLAALLEQFPDAKWYEWEPVHDDSILEGADLAFGQPVQTIYQLDRADVILSLDSDLLAGQATHLRYALDFADRRRPREATLDRGMSRLYVVESSPSTTGSRADHRLPLRPADIETFARAVANRLGVNVGDAPSLPEGVTEEWLAALVDDLQNYRLPDGQGGALVVAGPWQSAAVHALAHAMNAALGSVGRSVRYVEPITARQERKTTQLKTLVDELNAGEVETLIILGGNPVFTAPPEFELEKALTRAPFRAHTSLYIDETSAACPWHVPETHWLEAWSDVRAYDGTISIVQPLIRPLYDGVSRHTVLSALLGGAAESYDLVRSAWRERMSDLDDKAFEAQWRTVIHDGFLAESQAPEIAPTVAADLAMRLPAWEAPQALDESLEVEVAFRPDHSIFDGRYANNAWLQELPRPFTTLTWDNVALISPRTAERLRVKTESVIELEVGKHRVRMPAYVLVGHADQTITVHLGYGRTRVGRVGNGVGVNVYPLRSLETPWSAIGAIRVTSATYKLATVQHHFSMEGRTIVQDGTLAEWQAHPRHPEFLASSHHGEGGLPSLYPEVKYDGYKWGMKIDATACIGCWACVLGCQAENNIPVVGKEQVATGREMHWLRIDHYYDGEPENPAVHNFPVPCMHCENAPCEPVCPVAATVHGSEGLNEMVYNRCVGTRYCSNNCPYKVRRFNFLQYSDKSSPVLELLRNPDVTVRDRGVMEKCTYCIQRISAARIAVDKERAATGDGSLRIKDGGVQTACQNACPTQAIVFGDLNDPESRVAKLDHEPINYSLLEELNTRPRTTYLAEIRNPNPRLIS